MTTLDQIKKLIAVACGIRAAEVGDNQPLSHKEPDGLDLDSLDRLELAMAIEERFGIEFPDNDVDRSENGTAAGLAAYVEAKLALKGAKAPEVALAGTDYLAMSPGAMLSALGWDATKWALAFMQTACMANPLGKALRGFPHAPREELEEIMVGWFANAIMAGFDAGRNHVEPIDPMSFVHRFRKRPVEIEAVNYLGIHDGQMRFATRLNEMPEWLGEAISGAEGHAGSIWIEHGDEPGAAKTHVGTLEGHHMANPGDWIIRGVEGEIYPCKPEIFAKTYEIVSEAPALVAAE